MAKESSIAKVSKQTIFCNDWTSLASATWTFLPISVSPHSSFCVRSSARLLQESRSKKQQINMIKMSAQLTANTPWCKEARPPSLLKSSNLAILIRPTSHGKLSTVIVATAEVLRILRQKKWNYTFTKTSQELRMLSSVTINCQITKIVMNSGSQLSEL